MMAHVMNDALHSDLEDRVGELAAIKHLLYVLSDQLTFALDLDRGRVDGDIVTLKFGRDSLDAMSYLAAESWNRTGDLHEKLLAVLNESVSDSPALARAA